MTTNKHDFKSKLHSLVTYSTEDQLTKVLRAKSDFIEFAEFILHDQDQKEPHTHILLLLKAPRESKDVINWFKRCTDSKGEVANTMDKPVGNTYDAHEYLTHKNDKGKYQYKDEQIKVLIGDVETWLAQETVYDKSEAAKAKKQARQDENDELVDDILGGTSYREMARKYGRDYMKNANAYRRYCANIVIEEEHDIDKAMALCEDVVQNYRLEELRHAYVEGQTAIFDRVWQILQDSSERADNRIAMVEKLHDTFEKAKASQIDSKLF